MKGSQTLADYEYAQLNWYCGFAEISGELETTMQESFWLGESLLESQRERDCKQMRKLFCRVRVMTGKQKAVRVNEFDAEKWQDNLTIEEVRMWDASCLAFSNIQSWVYI